MRRFIVLILSLIWLRANAQVELPEIRQITTDPGLDLSPAISPDGKWLAWVSEASGNLDIWIRRLPHGKPIQITSHPAEDLDPAWSMNGLLAFSSKRRDPEGDIWSVKINPKNGKPDEPVPVTSEFGADRHPSFSPDGTEIVFASTRGGSTQLSVVRGDGGAVRPLTLFGGTRPAWSAKGVVFTSYRSDPNGDLFLIEPRQPETSDSASFARHVTFGPAIDDAANWSPDGKTVVFMRRSRDTNGDGAVTTADRPSLWQKTISDSTQTLSSSVEFQITAGLFGESNPAVAAEAVVFVSDKPGRDLWAVPSGGLFPRAETPEGQYLQVLNRFGEAVTEESLLQSILGYRRVVEFFPNDSVWSARALLSIGETNRSLSQSGDAAEAFKKIALNYPNQRNERAQAELNLAAISNESPEKRVESLKSLIAAYPDLERVRYEAWILLGDQYQKIDKGDLALDAYRQVDTAPDRYRNLKAQALLKIGDSFAERGRTDMARQIYFALLRENTDVPVWRERASGRLLRTTGTSKDRIRRLNEVIQESRDLPSLGAEAQLAIARVLETDGQNEQSLRELETMDGLYPSEIWAKAEAEIRRAKIHGRSGDELKGILLLEHVTRTYGDAEGGRYGMEARDALFDILLASADQAKIFGDLALAESRFRKALAIHPDDIRVHRGLAESVFRRGLIDALVLEYRQWIAKEPKNPSVLYGLGLALSYQADKEPDLFAESNGYLLQAIEEDYRLIPAYATLGFNYEGMEKTAENEAQKTRPFLVKAGRTLLSPVRWLIGLMPFGKKEGRTAYYEKAIDVQTTAIELNDAVRDPGLESLLAQNIANNFYNLGEFGHKKAFQYYQRRLSLDTTFSSPLEKAVFLEKMGHAGITAESYDTAAQCLQSAVDEFERLNRPEALLNLKRLAFLNQVAGNYEDAASLYEKIVPKDEKAGRWSDVELGYRNIAYCNFLMNEPADALKFARKAEAIFDTHSLPKGPSRKNALRIEFAGFSIPIWRMDDIGGASAEGLRLDEEKALVYGLESRSLEALKSFEDAAVYETKRLELFHDMKDKLAERMAETRLGRLHFQMTQYNEAWAHFEKALTASIKTKDQRGRWVNVMGLGNIAQVELSVLGRSDHLDAARLALEEEIKSILQEQSAFRREKLSLLTDLGNLWTMGSDTLLSVDGGERNAVENSIHRLWAMSHAQWYYTQALGYADDGGYKREAGMLLKNLAETSASAGDDSMAWECFNKCLPLLSQSQDELWRAEYGLAKLLERFRPTGEPDSASDPMSHYLRAMDRLESFPVQPEDSEERLSDRADRRRLYVDAAFAFAERNRPDEAFSAVERGREKLAADWLARRSPNLKRERHRNAWGNIRDAQSRLVGLRNQIEAALLEPRGRLRLDSLETEYGRITVEYRDALLKASDEDPVLSYLCGMRPVNIDKIRSLIPKDGLLAGYLVGDDKAWLSILSSDTLIQRELPWGETTLGPLVREINVRIQKDTLITPLAETLDSLVIAPLAGSLIGKSWIAFVPDGALWDLPLCALSQHGEFLSDSVTIQILPSFAAYELAWERRNINQKTGLLAGNPIDAPIREAMRQGLSAEALLGVDATLTRFSDKAQASDVVQIGTTMISRDQDPMASTLMFSAEPGNSGILHAADFFSWDLKSSLYVLPPSRSGGAAVLPFYYGLLYAGVPSVIYPMWPVTLKAQKDFADAFYGRLKSESAASALRSAQKALRRSPFTGNQSSLADDKSPPTGDQPHSRMADWAGYRLIGFQGFFPEERLRFASDNLTKTVRRGRSFETMGDFESAASQFEGALSMADATSDQASRQRIWNEIIRVTNQGKLWDKAIAYQNLLLQAAREKNDAGQMMLSFKNLVFFDVQAGKLDDAVGHRAESIRLLQASGSGDLPSAYEEMASLHALRKDYPEALVWAGRADSLYRADGNGIGHARARIIRGRFLLESEDAWSALSDLEPAVGMLDSVLKIHPDSIRVKSELASGLSLLGQALEKLGRYDEAMQAQERAFFMAAALNRPSQKASSLQNQANLFWIRGDYRNALSRQNEALALADSLRITALQLSGRSTLGLIQLSLGDAAKAMDAESKALELAKSSGRSVDQATILKNMGLVEIREGRFGAAVGYFLQATSLDSTAGAKAGMAADYRNLGQAYVRMGRSREAVPLFRQGLDLSIQVGDKRNQIQCRYGLGQALAELGEFESAIAVLDTGIQAASELGIPDLSWRLLRQRASLRSSLNRNEAALEDLRSAVETVEAMRAELKTDALKQGFLDDKMDLYVDAVKLLLDMNRPAEAFDFVERAKSRGFIDMLANQNLRLSDASGRRLDEEKAVRLSIQEVQARLSRIPSDSAFIPEKAKLAVLLAERRARYESLIDSIQTENPQLASFVSVDPWDAGRIQKLLPDSVVLVEYMATPKTLFLWAVNKERIVARTVEVGETDLRTQVQRFRETIQAYLSADTEGKSLYQRLFGPIEKELENARHVIVVPHGILHYLPFAALVDGQGKNPIDRFSLSFAPSATVWGWCAEKAARQTSGRDVLAISNPDLGDPKLALPFAAKEVQSLTRVYPHVEIYEAKAATKEAVREHAGSASIIHFACHGEYQPDSPLFSSLLLSPTPGDNGRLEAHEIFGLSLNCDLVTLSACETGLAKVTQGDEIIGLARSFIFAGAPSLITSLWKVDDLATAVMVKRFYRSLAAGVSKAEALRRAQLVVRDSVNGQPAAWAAFGLTGDFN